ncbi:phosphatase PAP2 family protein, partial [Patescibacteria group bacterium]|nr:phosphatase PAP2 family protein [Patescibacteria group bacterium]
PFVVLTDVNLLINPPLTAKSFPSDHAIISFALAFSVLMLHRRLGAVLLICAGAVAVGRVLVGVHYPLDVLAGAILGTAWALIITLIGRHLRDEARVDKLVTPKH